ncbi:hypothetical protein CEUSTIGMA_g274.t1 [Chlamydomonas eustigma]|uniref:Kri1-like C-terminal domain-containing protein n=1 Tax=Chlamydomonas eustigma TaxID=1157962 RepID=A0A250WQ49_9CHLO|nr:hypothetical protein CEUSTIGMA_g274.t1 [Chlamydomonas eustigma]|eukprot:GAX72819.1 hypothetical protein CEUSTIGMA_g274.t1 [Chlamydomonas eustigma]
MPRKNNNAGKTTLLDVDDEGELTIKINESYAKKFEHNKQREELHRLQEKHPELRGQNHVAFKRRSDQDLDEADGEESSSEDEDLGEIPEDTEEAILDTLLRIKHKDPIIYKPDIYFFKKEEEEEGEGLEDTKVPNTDAEEPPKKSRPLYLKDVLAKQALEHGPEIPSDEEAEEEGSTKRIVSATKHASKAYDQEQENLRKAFITAVEEADDGSKGAEDVFGGAVRRVMPEETEDEVLGLIQEADALVHEQHTRKGRKAEGKKNISKLADAYFGKAEDTSDDFLKQYILNKGWVDKTESGHYIPSYKEVVGDDGDIDDEEDEQYLQEAEKFEAKYNFRFEEPGGSSISGHPRVIEGTIRKEDDRRKRKRAEKAERLKEQEDRHREEVKRLKNLKKKEIEEKMSKLQKVAGSQVVAEKTMDELLEGEFDPDEWDKQMAQAFDEDYYEAEDEELEALLGDLDDPELDVGLDPTLGESDEDHDVEDVQGTAPRAQAVSNRGNASSSTGPVSNRGNASSSTGPVSTFKELRRRLKEIKAEEEQDAVNGEVGGESSEERAQRLAQQRAEVQKLLEEYYQLDYEDNIGGLRTRFRYKEVPAQTFGLSAEDILFRNDKELNQVIGLKRLAPYQENQQRIRPNYKALELLSKGGDQRSKKVRKQMNRGVTKREKGSKWKEAGTVSHLKEEIKRSPKAGQLQGAGKEKNSVSTGSYGAAASKNGLEFKAVNKQQRPQKSQHAQKKEHSVSISVSNSKVPASSSTDALAAARLASYAKLELKPKKERYGAESKKAGPDKGGELQGKRKTPETPVSDGPELTKAQRKNLKRTLKRAAKRVEDA